MLLKKIDFLFISFCIVYSTFLYYYVSMVLVPVGDAVDYLSNARDWLNNSQLTSIYRAPLISLIISMIWTFTGESWTVIKYFMPIFTLGSGVILYLFLRKFKGPWFAFGVSSLTLLNPQVFFWSTQIMTEAISLFFLVMSLYFMKSDKKSHWYLSGIFVGLTFASRYSILIEVGAIFLIECFIRKNRKFIIQNLVTAIPIVLLTVTLVIVKAGKFMGTSGGADAHFTYLLSPFYLENALNIWGPCFLLVPIAFFFRRTYADKFNYTFIVWFIVSLLFWSANPEPLLHSPRYIIQFIPSVYFLALLTIENIARADIRKEPLFQLGKRLSRG